MGGSYQQFLRDHWRGIQGEDKAPQDLRPFYSINREDDEELRQWLENTVNALEFEQEQRSERQLRYIRFYNGIQTLSQHSNIRAVDRDGNKMTDNAMWVLNHARDFINQSVTRITRTKAELNILPWNNEYSDRLGARFSKRVIDNLWYINDIDENFEQLVRDAKICGEAYLEIRWNPYIGDKSPQAEKAMAEVVAGKVTYAKDPETGIEYFENKDGEKIPLDIIRRVGDVEYQNPLPWQILLEPRTKYKDIDYAFKVNIKHIDEIRAENPGINIDKSSAIAGEVRSKYGDAFNMGDWVLEYEFFHRSMRFVDGGWYCKFINGQVLQSEKPNRSHGGLPFVRFTDFDTPESSHGVSMLDDLRPPLILYSKLMNLMYRNIAIGAHPKVMLPEGSANINSFANGPMVIEYQPPYKPELMTFQTISPEVFGFSDKLMSDTTKLSGTFAMSRGQALPNARAASILNFYEEQEELRESSQIKKYTAAIEKVGKYTLSDCGDNYTADDGRTLRVLGRNNAYKIRQLGDNVAKLSGQYNVKAERTTALAETKQGRIDQIVALSQNPVLSGANDTNPKPGLFTREQILRMIEVADTSTFFEMSTASSESAESENEDLFEGLPVEDPKQYQMHLVHWNVHYQFIQSREFSETTGVPEEIRDAFKTHLMTHEFFMYELAKVNMTFCQTLMENPYFPCFFELGANPTLAQLLMMHQTPPPPPLEEGQTGEESAPTEVAPAPSTSSGSAKVELVVSQGEKVPPPSFKFIRGQDGRIEEAIAVYDTPMAEEEIPQEEVIE